MTIDGHGTNGAGMIHGDCTRCWIAETYRIYKREDNNFKIKAYRTRNGSIYLLTRLFTDCGPVTEPNLNLTTMAWAIRNDMLKFTDDKFEPDNRIG